MEKRIIVNNVSKKFRIGFKRNQTALARFISLFSGKEPKKDLDVLKNISFEINSGEIVGVIGKNGSGKSTLLRVISGIYKQESGSITVNGKIISMINLNVGLKDRLTMKENIFLCGSLFGLGQKEIMKKFDSIVKFSELSEFVNTKIYQFSEGMKQRLGFSIAIHCNPQILLLDEVFEVGDEEFRKKSGERILEIVKGGGSVMLVTHDLEMVKKYCSKVILMKDGKIVKIGDTRKVVEEYLKRG